MPDPWADLPRARLAPLPTPLEPLSRFVQHRRRRVEQRQVVTGLGQRKRLMAGAAADVEHRRWRWRQMLEQLLVQHIGAHVPLH